MRYFCQMIIFTLGAASLFACASTAPQELVDARTAYRSAANGRAAEHARSHLLTAKEALDRAEKEFKSDGKDQDTLDHAYVARRLAELAEAQAAVEVARMDRGQVERTLELARARRSAAEQALASVEPPRRFVVNISGAVLFASGKSTLLPAAEKRLMDLVAALGTLSPDEKVIIEGYTDARGSDELNQKLSEERAWAVKSFLVSHGIEASRLEAMGYGESAPIATNSTAEGRANNRRVEIVIEKET